MVLDRLMTERKFVLNELKAFDELQVALEKIKRYNLENITGDDLKIYNTSNDPDLEEITESTVAKKIAQLTDDLLKLSERINDVKMKEAAKVST